MLQSAPHPHTLDSTGNAPPVLAFMHATAVNQDGRSSSLTAPNGPSQQGVIRQALQASALGPHQMHALQLHGTGMQLTLACTWDMQITHGCLRFCSSHALMFLPFL